MIFHANDINCIELIFSYGNWDGIYSVLLLGGVLDDGIFKGFIRVFWPLI
jgi:hypothetical protein